ncbi:hypothetical protein Catovirus_1_268 [Catovirus CTV1]|uniref:Uncharacterized protein n=1 Tax=Catovirus CTV1 TaxID=1977631 RepID=A0A1V0S995_9VIRU|nr:hypothetical protein Catovirus_1_268 [Catovirus CTV1]
MICAMPFIVTFCSKNNSHEKNMIVAKEMSTNNIVKTHECSNFFSFEHIIINNDNFDLTSIKSISIDCGNIIKEFPFDLFSDKCSLTKKRGKIYLDIRKNPFIPKYMLSKQENKIILICDQNVDFSIIFIETAVYSEYGDMALLKEQPTMSM